MGFPISWVRLIMECVTTVRYQVNSLMTSFLKVSVPREALDREIPCLLISFSFAQNGYLELFQLMSLQKRMRGLRVCRGASKFSLLFSADDSLFFLKAAVQNIACLKRIISICRGRELITLSQRWSFVRMCLVRFESSFLKLWQFVELRRILNT